MRAESLHTDGRTDVKIHITKLRVAFRYFANAPKNANCLWGYNVVYFGTHKPPFIRTYYLLHEGRGTINPALAYYIQFNKTL